MSKVTQPTSIQTCREATAEVLKTIDAALACRRFQPSPRSAATVAAELRAVEASIDTSAPMSDSYTVVVEHERKMGLVHALRAELRSLGGEA